MDAQKLINKSEGIQQASQLQQMQHPGPITMFEPRVNWVAVIFWVVYVILLSLGIYSAVRSAVEVAQ